MKDTMKLAAKRMAAIIAAGAMAVTPVAGSIGMTSVTAYAAMAGTQPSRSDTGEVKISNLEAGATVKLYKIVEADIDATAGYKGWKATASAGSSNVKEQTATDGTKSWKANIANLMTLINSGKGADNNNWTADYTGTVATGSTEYSATVAPGEYLAVVEPSGSNTTAYIYSPMLVSLFYVQDENGGWALCNADQSTTSADGSMTEAAGSAVYAKKSPVTLTKKISNPDGDASGNKTVTVADGEDLQVGDTQNFTITTAIPDYRGYSNLDENKLTFKLEDNQDEGFNKPKADPVVTVTTGTGDAATTKTLTAATDYTLTYGTFANVPDAEGGYGKFTSSDTGNDFTITFTKTALLANPGAAVTVTYSSVLNSSATQKSSANDNDVTLTYTNSNKTENNTGTLDDHTYDYSFPIDIVKVDASDNTTKLADAEFSIKRVAKKADNTGFEAFTDASHVAATQTGTSTDTEGNAKVVTAATTGLATFNHLDEGYYEIWESKAPSGYTQNTEHFYIGIAPTYTDGKLTSYTVTQYTSNGTAMSTTDTSSATLTHHTTIADATHDTLTVGDTKMSGLPSTGARSALILTICGVAVMVIVLAASRKKKMAD